MSTKLVISLLTVTILIFLGTLVFVHPKLPSTTPTPSEKPYNPLIPSPTSFIVPGVIDSTFPLDGSQGVSINSDLQINLDKSINPNDISVQITPSLPNTLRMVKETQTVIISPNQLMQKNTLYQVSVLFKGGNIYAFRFVTSNIVSDTGAVQYARQEEKLLQSTPDRFLTYNVPYSTNSFSITVGGYNKTPTGHYYFYIKIKTDKQSAQNDFNSWLKTLGLTDDQIKTLDIAYQ